METNDIQVLAQRLANFFGPNGALSKQLDNFESRPAQGQMAQAVLKTLVQGGVLIAEAATGTGKTLAYLVPALAAGKRVVVSTGTKNLQEQLFFKDIPFLASVGSDFKAAVMKGRGNYLCLRKQRIFQRQPMLNGMEQVNQFSEIESWSKETETGDFGELSNVTDGSLLHQLSCAADNCVGRKCEHFEKCWLIKMRNEAAAADIVIVNHHLLFADLSVREGGFGAVIPDYDRVIIDEAHEIEDVATGYFGEEINNWQFEELVRDTLTEMGDAKIKDDGIAKVATEIGNKAVEFFNALRPAGDRFHLRELFDQETVQPFQNLWDSLHAFESYLGTIDNRTEMIFNLIGRASELRKTLQFLFDMESHNHVYWGERRGKGTYLKASPIDVSSSIREKLMMEKESIILTSATLAVDNSYEYLRERIGIEEAEEVRLESHFDYKKQTRLYVPTHLPVPNDPQFIDEAVVELEKLLAVTKGRAFLLFTSLRNMEKAHHLLQQRVAYPLLLQGTDSRQNIMKKFREMEGSVLFASASFWQGVDVRGPDLSLVVIDKLPFAVPDDPLMAARLNMIKEEGGNPFKSLQIPSAAISLKQGLGRLIRSSDDYGIMAVLDSRLIQKYYGKIFLRSLHNSPVVTNIEAVKQWWQSSH
jgi:ATP-dependent DNA helicase DinG